MKKVMKNIFLKFMFNILKNDMTYTMIYHERIEPVRTKIEKVKKLVANLHIKMSMVFT